jgi:signal peptidase I
MSRRRGSSIIPVAIFLAILIIVLPVSAYNVAIYGTNAGFNPDLHANSVNVVRSIPGAAGADLDANVDLFTQPSVDVIILGGAATFSPSTAAKIEAAVAGGKILVVTYPCNQMFVQSLPASNGGTAAGGQYLEVSDPNSVVTKAVFAKLPTRFDLQGTAPDKEQAIAKVGTITVLNFDTGMPALLYGKYGKGYVVEWTTVPVLSYMDGTTADTVIHRMIVGLLPEPISTQTTNQSPVATSRTTAFIPKTTMVITQPIITTASPVQTTGTAATTGDVMVYSSPTGASILIDGNYFGTTPGKVNGIPAGNHILRLSLSGYYDYEGSIYVVPGDTTQGYGTLQPMNLVTSAPTTVPTPIPTAIVTVFVPVIPVTPTPTQDPGLLGNSSVLVALIGVITALIAAGASVFTHIKPPKKE